MIRVSENTSGTHSAGWWVFLFGWFGVFKSKNIRTRVLRISVLNRYTVGKFLIAGDRLGINSVSAVI